jgi:streptomycin 6-kinase
VVSRGVPDLDHELRSRLGRRFGPGVESWLDALPQALRDLAERWEIELGSLIQRGSFSVVIRCRTAEGRSAVLKVSPDQGRIREEASALAGWMTPHVPGVYAVDEGAGALLIEAIEPGTPLVESPEYPSTASLASLMRSLHADGLPDPAYRSVAERIECLFESSRKLYEWKPDLADLISPELYERGRTLALRLAAEGSAAVLLHGDLTPVNVLDGGEARGLVAIDPAPCIGDPAFDAIDLVLWRAGDAETVVRRIEELAPLLGCDAGRLLDWCAAFAGMVALEAGEASSDPSAQLQPLLALASRV